MNTPRKNVICLNSVLMSAILACLGWVIRQNQVLYELRGEFQSIKALLVQHLGTEHARK